jgi:hypothetical protein
MAVVGHSVKDIDEWLEDYKEMTATNPAFNRLGMKYTMVSKVTKYLGGSTVMESVRDNDIVSCFGGIVGAICGGITHTGNDEVLIVHVFDENSLDDVKEALNECNGSLLGEELRKGNAQSPVYGPFYSTLPEGVMWHTGYPADKGHYVAYAAHGVPSFGKWNQCFQSCLEGDMTEEFGLVQTLAGQSEEGHEVASEGCSVVHVARGEAAAAKLQSFLKFDGPPFVGDVEGAEEGSGDLINKQMVVLPARVKIGQIVHITGRPVPSKDVLCCGVGQMGFS